MKQKQTKKNQKKNAEHFVEKISLEFNIPDKHPFHFLNGKFYSVPISEIIEYKKNVLKREDLTLHTTISFVLNILNDSQIVKATITDEYIFQGPITKKTTQYVFAEKMFEQTRLLSQQQSLKEDKNNEQPVSSESTMVQPSSIEPTMTQPLMTQASTSNSSSTNIPTTQVVENSNYKKTVSKKDFTNKFRELMKPLYEIEGLRSFGFFEKNHSTRIIQIKSILLDYVPENESFGIRLSAAIRSSITEKHSTKKRED